MLLIIILCIALLFDPAIASGAESDCSQPSHLSAAQLRWAALRKSRVDPAHNDENCRAYGTNFFEAVMARHTASFCRDGIDRQRTLQLLDAEIKEFNDRIAAQCRG
jgi:hypothetical protein